MPRKILIVEDEEPILSLLSAIFDSFDDYRIICARDGEEAITLARRDDPDIILLDTGLPKINGYEVCRLIKSDPAMSHTRILMLSGLVQNFDLRKALEAGADGYIAKPFSPTELIERVKTEVGLI